MAKDTRWGQEGARARREAEVHISTGLRPTDTP